VFVFQVDEGLERIVDRFYEEAEQRGVPLQKNNLIVEFSETLDEDKCGLCTRPKRKKEIQRRVQISQTKICWDRLSTLNRETLLFHELGHCLLNRDHDDALFPSDAPKSIMTTVLDGPYQACVYVFVGSDNVEKCNLTVRRDYYLDELFGTNGGFVPDWGK
jgi:hypothetical protein